jgi:hypothetical protein
MDNLNTLVAGKPGMGKSTFIENDLFDEIAKGDRAIFLIDPHGEMVARIADTLPRRLIKRTVIIDPSHEAPVGFDPLRIPVEDIIAACKSIWADSWGPQLNYLLKYALMLLAENPGTTLDDLIRIYFDKYYRATLLERVKNPKTRRFWTETYRERFEQSRKEPDLPVINKIDTIATSAIARVLCQKSPKFDFRDALREKHVVLINLNNPHVGDEATAILGAFCTAAIRHAVLELNTPLILAGKQPHLAALYADEFPMYGTSLYAKMLAQMRKFGLNKIVLAAQYVAQLDETLRPAILSTTTRKVIFNLEHDDAKALSSAYNRPNQLFNPAAITELEPYQALVNGSQTAMPPFVPPYGTGKFNDVLERSRRAFGRRF